MQVRFTLRGTAVATTMALATLTGCTTTVPVKEMLDNRDQFLTTHFAPAKLKPEAKKAVDTAAVNTAHFKRMRITYKIDNDDDGKKKLLDGVSIVLDAGNGLFQQQVELSNNGFPYRVNNSLEYLGMVPLMWQSGFHDRAQSLFAYEWKEIKRLDKGLATPAAGKEYVIEGNTGTAVQVAGYIPQKTSCKLVETRAASTVHASLTGQTSIVECGHYDRNLSVVSSKHTYAMLNDYGFAVTLGSTSSVAKSSFQYTGFEITR